MLELVYLNKRLDHLHLSDLGNRVDPLQQPGILFLQTFILEKPNLQQLFTHIHPLCHVSHNLPVQPDLQYSPISYRINPYEKVSKRQYHLPSILVERKELMYCLTRVYVFLLPPALLIQSDTVFNPILHYKRIDHFESLPKIHITYLKLLNLSHIAIFTLLLPQLMLEYSHVISNTILFTKLLMKTVSETFTNKHCGPRTISLMLFNLLF